MMGEFRFQDLEIWRRAVKVTHALLDLADGLEERRLYRFAEQLRGAVLSIPNNIAEGSGSGSHREFSQFLNFARRSIFEAASMLCIFTERGLFSEKQRTTLLHELEELSRMITAFRRRLQ